MSSADLKSVQPSTLQASRPLVIAEIEQFGGAERSLLALSQWLYRNNLPSYLLTYHDHCGIARYANHPVTVVELKPGSGARRKIAALRHHLHERGSTRLMPLLSGYQPALHATLAGLRGFHDLMHDTPSLFSDGAARSFKNRLRIGLSNQIVGYGLRSGGQTIVTSEYLQSESRRDFGIQAHIARMGGLAGTTSMRLRTVQNKLRMISVCRIEANKRIDWMLTALAALERASRPLSTRIDWQLDLVGKGSLIDALQASAQSLGIADRIHFHGFVPDDQLEAIYEQAHLSLMPAIQGYGIPAIESIARGIPVLLHRESGVSDLLRETPWATVLYGAQADMPAALNAAIEGVLSASHHQVPAPVLPTEDQWAEQVARLCNWLA